MVMSRWYPDNLFYREAPLAVQNEDGFFTATSEEWRLVSICRREPSQRGSASVTDNALKSATDCVIYAPQRTELPKIGDKVRIETLEGIFEAQVTDAKNYTYNTVIWAR